MNAKNFIFSVILMILCAGSLSAQKAPWWYEYPDRLPKGNNFDYVPGFGEGKTETDARRASEIDSFIASRMKHGKVDILKDTLTKKIREKGISAVFAEQQTNCAPVRLPSAVETRNGFKVYVLYAWRVDSTNPVDFSEIKEFDKAEKLEDLNRRKKLSYLPFGIHQFCTQKDIGKGLLFSVTETGFPVLGVCLFNQYKNTYDAYLNEPYQSDVRHRDLEKRCNLEFVGSILAFTGAAAMIWWNYCDNRKYVKNIAFVPALTADWQGKPQLAMNLRITF